MRGPIRLILDAWAGLSHKSALESTSGRPWRAATWVGDHDRRLAAYKLLEAYYRNRARDFVSIDSDSRREYGDAALLVNVVRSAVTGDEIALAVEGAQDDAVAQARQDELDTWADNERLRAKILETERDTVKLGDGVYVLGVSQAKGRVRLRCFDPGFYFPAIDSNDAEDEFPRRVHLAWEYESGPEKAPRVRRITWELAPILPTVNPDGSPGALQRGDRLVEGRIVRDYPWNAEPSVLTCYMTDATWALGDLDGANVDTFPMDRALIAINDDGVVVNRLDLRLDFIPVIHLPNTVAIKEHFGEAVLTAVAQVLDELSAADTDAAKAAALAGVPVVAVSAASPEKTMTIEPGAVFGLGQGGRMDVVDLSPALKAVMEYIDSLLHRMSVNSRVPEEVLGRVKSSDIAAGILMALSFGPMRSLIEEMRLVRAEKYPLLLKFVQRMSIAAGFWAREVLPAQVHFGNYLPSDRAAAIAAVVSVHQAGLLSRASAIRRLVDEGVLDLDVAAELKACQAEDFKAALDLLEATDGDLDAVYEFLERNRPTPTQLGPVVTGE